MDCIKFVEFGKYTGEPILICGSSEADQSYAKRFWQSIELVPPLESRLVSGSNVKQRLKSAPPVGTPVACLPLNEEVNQPEEFFQMQAKAFESERLEAICQLEKFAYLRDMDLQRLENARQCRLAMERHVIPARQLNYRKANTSSISCNQLQKQVTSNNEEAANAIADINHFETCILQKCETSCPVVEYPDS